MNSSDKQGSPNTSTRNPNQKEEVYEGWHRNRKQQFEEKMRLYQSNKHCKSLVAWLVLGVSVLRNGFEEHVSTLSVH